MQRLFKIALALICSTVLMNPAAQAQLSGNKKITKEVRKVVPFSAVELSGKMDVLITRGSEYSVEVETDENLQEFITADVRNNLLRISAKSKVYTALTVRITLIDAVYIDADRARVQLMNAFNTPKFTVNVKGGGSFIANEGFTCENLTVNLTGGAAAGGVKPYIVSNKLMINSLSGSTAMMNVVTDKIELEATTAGLIRLEGKANDMVALATTAAKIDALQFVVSRASVKATTTAKIQVNVTEQLSGDKQTGGTIDVTGNPPKQTIF